jgi:predicted lipoprotein
LVAGDNITLTENNNGGNETITIASSGGGGAVDSVNGQTGVVVLDAADVGAATTAQGALADSALQSGDNVSELVNDAGYLTSYTETDTLQTVTNRGATTTNTVTISPSGNNKALVANGSGSGIGIDITHSGSGVKLNIGSSGSGDAIRFDTDKFIVADSGKISSSLYTASRALATNADKEIVTTATTATELGYVSGVTSAIQTQINTKIDGTLTANRVPYASDSNTLTDTPYFYYDSANSRLEVFSGLGTEKVTNGSFTGSASGWTLGSGFAYSSNSVSKTSNGTAGLTQSIGTILGEEYLIVFTISNYTAGTVTPVLGIVSGTAVSANGTYSQRIVPTNTGALAFNPSNTARFTIDSVSVKRLQGVSIATDAIGIGGANSSPSTTKAMFTFSHSNTSPNTTRAVAFNNAGGNTYLDFNFSGTNRSNIGANSGGELQLWASGANYVGFYNKATNSLMAYLTPSVFAG